jgi:hypothetical protein
MPTIKGYRVFALAVLVLVSFLPDAGAQISPGSNYSNDVELYSRYIPTRTAREQSGSVGISESDFNYDYQLKAFGQLPIDFSVNSQYFDINNSTAVFLPSHLTAVTTGIETTVPFFNLDRTYFHLGVFPSFYGDNWTFGSQEFRIPSKYYFIYKLNDQWVFLGGAAVYPDYDTTVSPIIGVIYKPNDKLTCFFVTDKQKISYALTERFTLFVEGGEKTDDEYIFTENTTKNAVLRYSEGHLGTGVKFKINENADVSLSGGEIFMNMFKYLDGNGKVVLNNGPYVELKAEVKI